MKQMATRRGGAGTSEETGSFTQSCPRACDDQAVARPRVGVMEAEEVERLDALARKGHLLAEVLGMFLAARARASNRGSSE